MKKLIFLIAFLLGVFITRSQVPEAFNYQAAVRNLSGEVVSNQQVKFRISILTGSETGTTIYSETHSVVTNNFGLANLKIGMGNNKTGIFSADAWGAESHFMKIELDINGGDSFIHMGTSQLLAVPYAFHASSAENLTDVIPETDPVYSSSVSSGISATDTERWNNKLDNYIEIDPIFTGWDKNYADLAEKPDIKDSILTYVSGSETKLSAGQNIEIAGDGTNSNPYVISGSGIGSGHFPGELFGGGIVFYVYDNGLHGLIASLEDLSDGIIWGNLVTDVSEAESPYDGAANTSAIVAQVGAGSSYAAGLCEAYTGGGQMDWYLPSSWELYLLYNAAFLVSFKLENDSDVSTHGLNFVMPFYWSSTEYPLWSNAWLIDVSRGQLLNDLKSNISNVRAIRRF